MSKGTLWSLQIGITVLGLAIIGFLFSTQENPMFGAIASLLLGIVSVSFATYILTMKDEITPKAVVPKNKRERTNMSWAHVKGKSTNSVPERYSNPDDYKKKKINPFSLGSLL